MTTENHDPNSGSPSEGKHEERPYCTRMTEQEKSDLHDLIESQIAAQTPEAQAITRRLFREHHARLQERPRPFHGGKDDTEQVINGDLKLRSDGTLIWGQTPVQDTAGNARAAVLIAIGEAVVYMGWLAYRGCGAAAAALAADIALGNFANMSTLTSCMWLGYGSGGDECEFCY